MGADIDKGGERYIQMWGQILTKMEKDIHKRGGKY